ncbi:lytic transglycosylase domain-containing protein [Vibrio astriarenae]
MLKKETQLLTKYQPRIEATLERNGDLVRRIESELLRKNLPKEFILIPMLESSYNPEAVSHAKAAGLWQLMPQTARRFGLVVDSNLDQRFDIPSATFAALEYLSFLYDKFGQNINLTLAAYNAGEGRVQRAQKSANNTDFGRLTLPSETVQYVHRFHALLSILNIQSSLGYGASDLFRSSGSVLNLYGGQAVALPLVNLEPLPPLVDL